jgi:hypothetical protein
MRLCFKMLSDQFAKDCLFGEIFGSDDETIAPRWAAGNGRERYRSKYHGEFDEPAHQAHEPLGAQEFTERRRDFI